MENSSEWASVSSLLVKSLFENYQKYFAKDYFAVDWREYVESMNRCF